MRVPILSIVPYLGFFILAGIFVTTVDNQYLDAPLLLLIVMRLTTTRSRARLLAILVCLVVEMNSPFPGLIYGTSILVGYFFLDLYALRFVSRQTFLGIFICGALAVTVSEVFRLLLTFLELGSPLGWVPDFNFAYWVAFARRGIITATLAAIIGVLGIRFYSPRLRGIVIANS